MTHDELLAIVIDYETGLNNGMIRKENVFAVAKAFRAVVELHKPWVNGQMYCQVCVGQSYPCSTIQAIEKELV